MCWQTCAGSRQKVPPPRHGTTPAGMQKQPVAVTLNSMPQNVPAGHVPPHIGKPPTTVSGPHGMRAMVVDVVLVLVVEVELVVVAGGFTRAGTQNSARLVRVGTSAPNWSAVNGLRVGNERRPVL